MKQKQKKNISIPSPMCFASSTKWQVKEFCSDQTPTSIMLGISNTAVKPIQQN